MPISNTTTWNPADTGPGLALSNGNLTITGTPGTGDSLVRAASSQATGKAYWEITVTDADGADTGFGICTGTTTSQEFGFQGKGGAVAYAAYADGTVYGADIAGTSRPQIGEFYADALLCIAVDFDAQLAWFRVGPTGSWNDSSGNANDPAAGTGGVIFNTPGPWFPAVVGTDGADFDTTANFGATPFAGTPPAGFYGGTTATPPPVSGHRYWQILITSGQDAYTLYQMAEVEFRTVQGTPRAFSGGVASASSVLNSSYTAAAATDRAPGTFWSSSGKTPPNYWRYAYPAGQGIDVAEVLIQTRGDAGADGAPFTFDLQYSDDAATWTTKKSFTAAPWTTLGQIQTFSVADAPPAVAAGSPGFAMILA